MQIGDRSRARGLANPGYAAERAEVREGGPEEQSFGLCLRRLVGKTNGESRIEFIVGIGKVHGTAKKKANDTGIQWIMYRDFVK